MNKKEVVLSTGRQLTFLDFALHGLDTGTGWFSIKYEANPPLVLQGLKTLYLHSSEGGEIEDAAISFVCENFQPAKKMPLFLSHNLTTKDEIVLQQMLDPSSISLDLKIKLTDIDEVFKEFAFVVRFQTGEIESALMLTQVRKGSDLWKKLEREVKRYLVVKGFNVENFKLEEIYSNPSHFYLDKSAWERENLEKKQNWLKK